MNKDGKNYLPLFHLIQGQNLPLLPFYDQNLYNAGN